jgi:hypothetical protein
MRQPSDTQGRNTIIDCGDFQCRLIKWRLDLVYRYKKHFDHSAEVSAEEIDFVNGFMKPTQMIHFIQRYESAIAHAVEVAEATARLTRLQVLTRRVGAGA